MLVPSRDVAGGHCAELVVYCVGEAAIGGFLRCHAERSARDNLNRPGMRFEPVTFGPRSGPDVSDAEAEDTLSILPARVGVLAMGCELARL